MLKSRKNVRIIRNIIIVLMAIIIMLGFYIKINNSLTKEIEINTIATENFGQMKSAFAEIESRETVAAIDLENGTIIPKYKPEWTKVSSALDETNQKLQITVKGSAYKVQSIDSNVSINYASNVTSTLAPEDIIVFIDGEEVTSTLEKQVSAGTITTNPISGKSEVTHVITLSNFEEAVRRTGKYFNYWSGNVSIKIAGRGESTETYLANILTDIYGNQSMMETDESGTWVNVEFNDGEITENTDGTMFADFIKPEITYVSSETTIDYNNKVLTVIFYAADKYFDSTESSLALSDLTVKVDGQPIVVNNTSDEATRRNTLTSEAMADGIGTKYTLTIKNLQENPADGYTYSGPVSIIIPENKFHDTSGNPNDEKTITIGVDEPGGTGEETIVDVVDPAWVGQNIIKNDESKTATIDLIATDKYYVSQSLTTDKIKVYIDGVLDGDTNGNGVIDTGETPTITKALNTASYVKKDGSGNFVTATVADATGEKYTLTLGGWASDLYSGTTKIVIEADTIIDESENTSVEQEFTLGHIDSVKPVIEKVTETTLDDNDVANKTETIVVNVMDKYLNTSDPLEASEIRVYIDGELATDIVPVVTKVQDFTSTVNGNSAHVIGQQYKIVISGLDEKDKNRTSIPDSRKYKDWSGTVSIEIIEGAVKDIEEDSSGGNLNEETTIVGDFVDYINPEVVYQYSSADIDYDHKTFTMIFDVRDKYFANSTLTMENFETIITDIRVLEDAENDNVFESILDDENVKKSITAVENVIQETAMNKTVGGVVQTGLTNQVIGKRYTILLEDLEQDQLTAVGEEYLNYSGVIQLVVPANMATDMGPTGDGTNPNGNEGKTISSGVSIPGSTDSDRVIVDVVDPIWEQTGTATATPVRRTASLTVKGTDKYLPKDDSGNLYFREVSGTKIYDLTSSDIQVAVNGIIVGDANENGIIDSGEIAGDANGNGVIDGTEREITLEITEDTSVSLAYGKQYNIRVTGFVSDAYQVKLIFNEGIMVDESGNPSKETEFVLFSCLRSTATETEPTSGFLGSDFDWDEDGSPDSNLQRQYVEKVIFKNNLDGVNETRWDASAQEDGSIIAWYTTRTVNGTTLYTVYIGSYIIMNGNADSTNLFKYIGYNENCVVTGDNEAVDDTSKQLIENLELVHFDNVTNMTSMFESFGYSTMKSLDLGDAFDTSAVINMNSMFDGCGTTAMISLNLGDEFDTSAVERMNLMFYQCGYNAMTSLYLGDKFDTSNVTSMESMFGDCGYTAMTSLDLGDKFDTTNVTDEYGMKGMFENCGYTAMTSLDLGDKFDTSNVTDMNYMFSGCGYNAMTFLDLGPAFTRIPDTWSYEFGGVEFTENAHEGFIINTGKLGCVIYAPESIYNDMKHLKLDTNSTTTIEYIDMEIDEDGWPTEEILGTRGTINPVYKPEWTKVSSSLNTTTGEMTLVVKGDANKIGTPISAINYTSDITYGLNPSAITVYIDGEKADEIIKSVSTATTVTNTETGNPKEVQYTITLSNFEQATRLAGKNFKEWSGNIAVQLAKGTLVDVYGNQNLAVIDTAVDGKIEIEDTAVNANTTGKLFSDVIKPEFTYEYSNTTIEHGEEAANEKVTIVFDVTDKYFASTQLAADPTGSLITVKVDNDANADSVITKSLNKKTIAADEVVGNITYKTDGSIWYTVNGTSQKVGERYELVITGLDQVDGFLYSGYMTLVFDEEIITDTSGNKSNGKTITIGVDEPGGNDADKVVVDVADPIWVMENLQENIGATPEASTVTVDLIAKDKYFQQSTLTTGDITITLDDVQLTSAVTDVNVKKSLSTPQYVKLDESGAYVVTENQDEAIGVKYTLTLSDWVGVNKIFTDSDLKSRQYREYSGTTEITIAKNTITDRYTNTSNEQTFDLGHIDFVKPEIEKVTSTKDATAKTETIVFSVTDKYLDTTSGNEITPEEITVYVDDEEADLTKSLTHTEIKEGSTVVGHEYTLVLSDFEKARNAKGYKDWSGTVSIEIAANAIQDTSENKNNVKEIVGDFVDFINPDLQYTHQSTDINTGTKTYTMTFDITDKYYTSGQFTQDDITNGNIEILMQNGQKDASGNPIVYNLKNEPVTIALTSVAKTAPSVKVTNASTGVVETVATHTIGHTYTLTISNLEQLEIKTGLTTADYSGVITVAIPGDRIVDRSNNKNTSETITSGVNFPGGTGNGTVVDVVDPLWTKVSSSALAKEPTDAVDATAGTGTATITFKGTDTYFDAERSTLTSDNIKVFVNGSEVTTGITKNLSTATVLEEERTTNGTTSTVQYGVQYTLTLTGWVQNADQVKIQIPKGVLVDETGNDSELKEFILYNCLELTSTENSDTGSLLGNSSIARANVENVTFKTNLDDAPITIEDDGTITLGSNAWDVSAQNDKSIIAWHTQTTAQAAKGVYTVYIASDEEIFANQYSRNLFAYLGYSSNSTAEEVITNLHLLNTSSVIYMAYMFNYCGYTAMTTLDLGTFDTSNVTDMHNMFLSCGGTAMTTLDLGENFDTSNVTNMEYMFYRTGYTAMTGLSLGAKFDTSNVTDMNRMFQSCGEKAMTTLDLGENFDTSNVTNMEYMFYMCGRELMTTLDLKDKFNTINVTNMSNMFYEIAKLTNLKLGDKFDTRNVTNMEHMFAYLYAMQHLDLGDKFYTTSAENMNRMFRKSSALKTLDLGPVFTRIPDGTVTYESEEIPAYTKMFADAGGTDCVIFAPESIYNSMTQFKLGTNSTTTIEYTNGIIKPVYKPEWEKISSTIDETNKTISVTFKGYANETFTNGSYTGTYTSEVQSYIPVGTNLTAEQQALINVYIDGELAEGITKAVAQNSVTANEVQYTITLSNFEEALRQSGKNFKEWSGNIAIQPVSGTLIDKYGSYLTTETQTDGDGNEVEVQVPVTNVFTDTSGNKLGNANMDEIDLTQDVWTRVELKDETTIDTNTNGTMFTDYIKPEFTYKYSNTDINHGDKTLTVVFDVTDKYFNSSDIDTDDITVAMLDDASSDVNTKVSKTLNVKTIDADVTDGNITYKTDGSIEYNFNGTSRKNGTRYELVIGNLQQDPNDAYNYSGPISISFLSGLASDKSGNTNNSKTITIGVDEPGGSEEDKVTVDVVDPIWISENLTTTTTNGITTATVDLIATDKYFAEVIPTTEELEDLIEVKVAGVNIEGNDANGNPIAPDITRTLEFVRYVKQDASGNYVEATETDAQGAKFKYTISNIEETDETFFAERAKYANDSSTGRLYREYSGPTELKVPADTIIDEYGNKNAVLSINVGDIDTLKPEVIKVSEEKVINETNVELSTYKIVFDIVDKYMNSSSITTTDTSRIHVYLDGELTEVDIDGDGDLEDTVTKTITNIQTLTDTVNGQNRTVGYRYTLELSEFENARTSIDYDRLYTDWSGDISIKIDANTALDTKGTGNDETILYGNEANSYNKESAQHVDYIKPDATYKYSEADVDTTDKKFTMVFDITDKFFNDDIDITNLQMIMSAEEETGEGEDGYYNLMEIPIIRDNLSLQMEEIKNNVVTDVVNGVPVKEEKVIGKRYTLVISNLEQVQKVEGNYYLDYSGSITITVPEGTVTDTSGNGNNPISITSGIDIPGGEITDISEVDVVDPLWEKTAYTTNIHTKTATVTIEGTDKYFYEVDDTTTTDDDGYGTLTLEEIKLIVNGAEATGTISEGIKTFVDSEGNLVGKLAIDAGTKLYEQRIVQTEYGDGDVDTGYTTETVQYGIRYALTFTEFDITKNQVKIQLPEGSLVDQTGNQSNVTDLFVYNSLKTATDASGNWEDQGDSGFLGNANIERQDIEKIEFVSGLDDAPAINTTTCWDVSAQRDNSILAWTNQTTAPYTVYIGSNDDIYGNIDSSYLFSYIGFGESCTATEAITNIGLLNTSNVTNMSHMFNSFGYRAITSLNLGSNFDTSNVTSMNKMFADCGVCSMISFDLGDKFDTSSVTNMDYMFYLCGYTALTSLDLGDKFDTSAVTNMTAMFNGCGYTAMTSLDLGDKFDTSAVTNMTAMFTACGYTAMTSLDLGDKFDTSSVTDMSGMFNGCGYTAMTSLDLGDKFDTSAVTNMTAMFNACGYTAMTSLDLGDKFDTRNVTDMSYMFEACGYTALTGLDLGDKFYTTSVTDMTNMFNACGNTVMTTLNLGPAFTKIADTNTDFVTNTGVTNCIIYVPESIYNDMKHFKLSRDSETTIEYTQGTINPVYKPEWERVADTTVIDETNKTISLNIKGYANETFTNGSYTGTYTSAISSYLPVGETLTTEQAKLINVYIDGELDGDINRNGILDEGETPTITRKVEEVSITETEVQYKITLSNFEQATRQTGKNFKEWSGNIAIQPVSETLIDKYGSYLTTETQTDDDGNETEVQVPVTAVFTDASGNKLGNANMDEIDLTQGVWTRVELKDETTIDTNTDGTMFTDYIKPEFTYEYADTVIGNGPTGDKKVRLIFDVTDKYFKETALATDSTANNITVKVDEDAEANSNITKTLTKKTIAEDVIDGDITYKANGDIYYTDIYGTSKKIGERYELLIEGLQSSDGVGYSGPMSLIFEDNIVTDLSDNVNDEKTITIGIDEPTNTEHPDHNTEVVVDVVNPIWSYTTSDIDRTNDEVNIYIIGSDKYYANDVFAQAIEAGTTTALETALNKIKVYVDETEETSIVKEIEAITVTEELAAGAGLTDLIENNQTEASVGYKLTLSGFGDQFEDISGITKVVIEPGTITDESNNQNIETTINVGNIEWEEANEPLETTDANYPRYTAFRNHIVDFIDPIITYEYSTVEGSENPDVDYEGKKVTVKFTVSDKYLLESDLMETITDGEGNSILIPKNISVVVDNETVYENDGDDTTTDTRNVTATITSADITDTVNGVANTVVGKEYTLVVSNIQQENPDQPGNTTPENGDGFDFSGPMQLVFTEGAIDDTSGNKNAQKTITLDTEIGPDIVDVVDPIIYWTYSEIDRSAKTVALNLKAEDKYLTSETLRSLLDNVLVKVVKPNGQTVTDRILTTAEDGTITSADNENSTITKEVTNYSNQGQYMTFRILISNFGEDEGVTSIIIPADTIKDTSGNGNIETEILVGNSSDGTAFGQNIVDFTKPTWNYQTSSIQRDFDNTTDRRLENGEISIDESITGDGTVTLEVKGTDIYFDDTYFSDSTKQLNLSNVKVYVNGVENTNITKAFATNDDGSIKKEYITETAENGDILKGVKYTLILGNFGTNDGTVKIEIPQNVIRDTSTNGNILTQIDVGNPEWVEEDDPKYTAFRDDFVDFIKPVITQDTATIDRTNNEVNITFDVTDTNFLESNIGLEDIKVFVDDDYEMQVYGTGANTDTAISAELSYVDLPEEDGNGIKYTLTLSDFELDSRLTEEMFLRHSGRIRLVIAQDQVFDTSGNPNNEKTITINEFTESDNTTSPVADLIKPIIYYNSKYINWAERYAEITIRATDRFYDTNTQLEPSDLTLYEEVDGQYIQITDFNDKIGITRKSLIDEFDNLLGYDYIIKLNDFEEEFKMKVVVAGNQLGDTSGNYNELTEIVVALDNQKPRWEYVSTDTTKFESDGEITFNVKGVDKFLDMTNSGLEAGDLKLLLDGEDITGTAGINIGVTANGTDTAEKSMSYKIDITGLTEVGTYSLVFEAETLVDEFTNKSAAKTITFSKSAIASNTGNYTMVTYHVSPDQESVHNSFVHELMSVNTTGTNFENTTYRPSTLGELHNNGENPLFAEPMYDPYVASDGYTINYSYAPKSFAGWAEADEKGNQVYYTDNTYTTVSETQTTFTRVYGLYDEIPNTITNLKAIWQEATVVFVSNTDGDNTNNGELPTTPVKDITTAYSKLDTSGTSTNNIIVIMDAVEWSGNTTLSGNTTITSLYAGVDYRATGAELKISSNMTVNGDIIFDNIKLYADSTTVSDGTDYVGNGTYSNMLVSNYSGDITLGRGITTPDGKYTFGAVIGGNYKTETGAGEQGTHTIRVEAGKYNNIIAGSTLTSSTTTTKSITHEVVIGNMRDTAVSRNDKLTITGYVAIGENEQKCYPSGSSATAGAATKTYANVTLYSGTFTGDNKFAKASEDIAIYLRSINGQTDGKITFNMYGGLVNKNIYGGASATTYTGDNYNTMNFYGGQVIGNVFGQSANQTFKGGSTLTFEGNFNMTGDIFGGSNVTTTLDSIGSGSSSITVNSSSITINGNIYGGGKSTVSGYIDGTTTITLNAGVVNNIYGAGYGCDNTGATNITINNGTVNQNIYGGAYQAQARSTSNITVLGGTVQGNIYGGNNNTQEMLDAEGTSTLQDVNIIIGDTDSEKAPTINGIIYGSGIYDRLDNVEIQLIECANITSVYGGSNSDGVTATVNIYLNGMTVNQIYGGGQSAGTIGEATIYLQSGTAIDVYGGGYSASVTETNIILEGTATVGSIYGGSSTSGTVTTSNVMLTSGTLTNVFGGGNSASVGTSNVTLNGITIDAIHGGSKDAGVTTTSNVILTSGTVGNVYGGGLDVGVTTSNVTHQGSAVVTSIYGGNNSGTGSGGDTGTTNINISSNVANVYGGNYLKGTTRYSNITIHGTPTITGQLFGGGYKSAIGKSGETGSTTINIAGGTINKDINGGSEESIVYGTTNINIGADSFTSTDCTKGNIIIKGTIYGAGSSTNEGYSDISVQGETHILMDNSTASPITYSKTIYGSGNGSTYSNTTNNSTIHLKDFGTSHTDTHELISIERTDNLYIGNSFIEFIGRQDKYNYQTRTSYTLNRITNGLTVYDNTTLYTRRGFNMVGGFNSYKTFNASTKSGVSATVTISDGTATTNVDNRLYTLEGVNLIFAKQEGNIYANASQDIWGDVKGMTFFGMYAINRTTNTKQYDIYAPNYSGGAVEGFFANGTYVEGRHKTNHDITVDGFYTNVAEYGDSITVTPQVIETTDFGTYYDWIIGADVVNYEISLIGSTYGKESMTELLLDYKYAAGATYTLNRVSLNALNTDVNLIDSLTVPTTSTNANKTFGLTMETANSGWLNRAESNIYTASNGSFAGDTSYESDKSATPGTIIFKLNNSLNITEKNDLGNVNIILTGRTPAGTDGTPGNTFIVVIAVNIQTVVDELSNQYEPRFTDSTDTELSYTSDSKVDLTYTLYNNMETTPYQTGDYRVISSTVQLPTGTRLTMKDHGDNSKLYYYHVTDSTQYTTETKDGVTRYIYKLSEFIEMGSTTSKYADNNSTYYHSSGDSGYILEKYDISIDFGDSNISTDKLSQETYLELRSSGGAEKYDNGDTDIKYNLYSNKNAVMTETISNKETSYSVVETLDIPFTLNTSILEQEGIMDTKYYDQIAGVAIEIVSEQGIRINAPELQNFKLTNAKDATEVYTADHLGVIRVPMMEGLSTMTGDYTLSLAQANVPPGNYTVKVYFFTSDNGTHYGSEPVMEKEFYITFISRLLGAAGVEATDDSRIINKATKQNLEGNSGIDMTINIAQPTSETNLRVELYKRNPTYTVVDDVETYNGTTYTLVDLTQYLDGTWETPSTYGLTAENQYEYMVSPKETYQTIPELKTIELEKALKDGITTGEYKLVFKAYHDDTLVQTIKKTFIVTE